MPHPSAKQQLFLILTVILSFAFIGGSLINYKMTRASVHSEIIQNDLPLTMDNIYSELTAEMTRPLLVSSSMASDTFLKDWATAGETDPEKVIRYLEQIKVQYGFFTTFYVSAKSQKYYRYNGIHKTVSKEDEHDIWFYNFLSSGREYHFDVDSDEAAKNSLTIFINYKVLGKNGETLGVAGVGLMVDKVAESIKMYQKKYARAVFLTDHSGVFQVHPDTSLIEKSKIQDIHGLQALASGILSRKENFGNYEYEQNGRKVFLTVRYIDALDWYLFVEQNESEALRTARQNFIRTMLIGILTSVLILGLVWITIRRYQSRIELLASSDELTGVANRRALEIEFQKTLYNYSRNKTDFHLILLDLDNFKQINDTFGHIVGDKLLVDIVNVIKSTIRPTDIFARWGGDEFVILTVGDLNSTTTISQRICEKVKKEDFAVVDSAENDPRNQVRVSCGITQYAVGDDLDSMLLRADSAMYKCKARGGDCAVIEKES